MVKAFMNMIAPPKRRLLIAETSSSTYNYHLRVVAEGDEKFGGGAGKALCGRELGWDTRIPLSTYGVVGHLNERYCKHCMDIAIRANMPGSESLGNN